MASDDEDDLLALRAAALATMKKKPEVEDVQPIPQLTSSGHSLNSISKPTWAESDFSYDDHLPFQDHELVDPFPPSVVPPQPQFGLPPQFPQSNWLGPRRGSMGLRPIGPRGVNFECFPRGNCGPFLSRQGALFGGRSQLPPFSQRMSFLPKQRLPLQFPPNQHHMPFKPRQPQRPPFVQNPMLFNAGLPHGGGGNLIVINTVPERGEEPFGFPGQKPPFLVGANPPRGRGGNHMGRGRGRDRGHGGDGSGGNLPLVDSSSKLLLLRPQDKYCPLAESSATDIESTQERVHRKKKDKFSRYNSSDDESDDDESEEESEDDLPSRQQSVGRGEVEEKETVGSEDMTEDQILQKQSDIPDAELSIDAMNSSQLLSDQLELDKPVIDGLAEPVIDSVGESVINSQAEGENVSEPELNEEVENRLLASSSRLSDSGSEHVERWSRQCSSSDNGGTPVRDESPLQNILSHGSDDSPVREASPEENLTPFRDESFDNDADATPVRDESPEHVDSPTESSGRDDQEGSFQSDESASDSDSESGDESDSVSGSSSSSSSSGKDASKSSSNSGSEVSDTKKSSESLSDNDSDYDMPVSDKASDSESEEDGTVEHLPAKHKHSERSRHNKASLPPKPKEVLTPEEKARMEARKRKFESGQEVKVTGSTRTISLKGITSNSLKSVTLGGKSSEDTKKETLTVKKSRIHESSTRKMQTKSNNLDFHHKQLRRKVSIEKPVLAKSDSNSETENKLESEEEEEEEEEEYSRSRAWRREATIASHRKHVVSRSLRHSDSYYRGSNRNGGYYGREHESQKDSRPEVHYSSSEDDQDSDRKLISVVVPRSAADTHHGNRQSRCDVARSFVQGRKRTSEMARFDRDNERHSHPKSKRLKDFIPGNDKSGCFNKMITGECSSALTSQTSEGRVPVHQRLGKTKRRPHAGSSRSRRTAHPGAKNRSDSASEGWPHLLRRQRRIPCLLRGYRPKNADWHAVYNREQPYQAYLEPPYYDYRVFVPRYGPQKRKVLRLNFMGFVEKEREGGNY